MLQIPEPSLWDDHRRTQGVSSQVFALTPDTWRWNLSTSLYLHSCYPTPGIVVTHLDSGYRLLTVPPASAPLPLQSTATRVTLRALSDHGLPCFLLDLESNITFLLACKALCDPVLQLWPYTGYQTHFCPRAFGLAIPSACQDLLPILYTIGSFSFPPKTCFP